MKENSNAPQYPILGNPMDRGAWQATDHRVAKELDMTLQQNNNNLSIYKAMQTPDISLTLRDF